MARGISTEQAKFEYISAINSGFALKAASVNDSTILTTLKARCPAITDAVIIVERPAVLELLRLTAQDFA